VDRYEQVDELKAALRPLQQAGLRIGFVPTMGALHEGHLSLVRNALGRAEVVVASVFVNPLQFGPREDLDRYPRDLDGDAKKLEEAGCHVLFTPDSGVMFPPGFQTRVSVAEVQKGLCGDRRPGHFDGVATVVAKLFGIVRPDVAVFGEKDFQQLALVRTMVADLNLDVEVVGAPLVREPDGLARSSRNALLSEDERIRAVALSRGLFRARTAHGEGERSAAVLEGIVKKTLAEAQVEPEYVELRAFDGLERLERADAPCVLLVAARVGSTRLIDNLILRRP
jgi:pantoate--beta-alanine ligase